MKKLSSIIFLLFAIGMVSQAQVLTVEVKGIEKIKGCLYMGFYNSSGTFLKKPVTGVKADVTGKVMVVPVENLSKGVYAISMFQDENGNGRLDKGMMGIPKEKYGFSNDAMGYAGPPSFKAAKFEFRNNKRIIINLK